MLKLISELKERLAWMENEINQGVIPGHLDTCELQEIKSRHKELKFILFLLSDDDNNEEFSE